MERNWETERKIATLKDEAAAEEEVAGVSASGNIRITEQRQRVGSCV